MTDTPPEAADKIRRLTVDLERAREDLAFMGRNTLPELRREVEHQREGKQRWRARAEKAEARVAELEAVSAAVVPAADRTALRDRIADKLADADGWRWAPDCKAQSLAWQDYLRRADGVLSVLPAPADRATALEEAADEAERVAESLRAHHEFERSTGALDVMTELRRMAVESAAVDRVAAETPPAETPVHAVPVPGSNGISSCCGRPPCEFVGERVTRDPAAVTCPGPAVEAQPGKDTETPQPKEA